MDSSGQVLVCQNINLEEKNVLSLLWNPVEAMKCEMRILNLIFEGHGYAVLKKLFKVPLFWPQEPMKMKIPPKFFQVLCLLAVLLLFSDLAS